MAQKRERKGLLANIVSFGAAGRIDDALDGLEEIQEWYEGLWHQVEDRRLSVTVTLERLVEAKRNAHQSLSRIRELTSGLSVRERTFIAGQPAVGGVRADLGSVYATLDAGDTAIAAAKGGGAAVSGAMGAWALVGAYGAASTGTAISGLTGAAAFNATLAWFGGGSIAAGGAGMAGGAAVLGGIVAVPALALMAMFSHISANKKIAEIKDHANKVIAEVDKCERAIVVMDAIDARAEEVRVSIQAAHRAFDHEFERAARALWRPWYSRLWAWLRTLFGGSRYSDDEVRQIAEIGSLATALARIIDTPILDQNGVPT